MKNAFFILLTLLFWAPLSAASEHGYQAEDGEDVLPWVEIKSADDLRALGVEARAGDKVILLEMSAPYCGYCRTLEDEIIKPMLRNRDYDERVIIRKLDISRQYPIPDFNGGKTTPAQIASRYGVFVTPTLVFLDGDGREAGERILGVNTLEFYGGYVDEALDQAYHKINHPKYVYKTD
jgi:thioredoxin-related protein